jgi:hypothetical protein
VSPSEEGGTIRGLLCQRPPSDPISTNRELEARVRPNLVAALLTLRCHPCFTSLYSATTTGAARCAVRLLADSPARSTPRANRPHQELRLAELNPLRPFRHGRSARLPHLCIPERAATVIRRRPRFRPIRFISSVGEHSPEVSCSPAYHLHPA